MGTGEAIDDGAADGRNVAAGGEIHHGVGTVVHGAMQLFEFVVHVGSRGGIADVSVDLAEESHADAHGLEIAMMDIGGNDGAAAGDFVANKFGREFFALRNIHHFLGDCALTREMHLREIFCARAVARNLRASVHRCPALFNPRITHCHWNLPFAPGSASRRAGKATLSHCDWSGATCAAVGALP